MYYVLHTTKCRIELQATLFLRWWWIYVETKDKSYRSRTHKAEACFALSAIQRIVSMRIATKKRGHSRLSRMQPRLKYCLRSSIANFVFLNHTRTNSLINKLSLNDLYEENVKTYDIMQVLILSKFTWQLF